jgi:hypothetical protein
VGSKLFDLPLRKRATLVVLLALNHLFLTIINETDLNGLLSIEIGQKINGFRSFGATRLMLSPEGIQDLKLLEKSAILSYITLIVSNHVSNERLAGCFGARYLVNTDGIQACFGRRIGRQSTKVYTPESLSHEFKLSCKNTLIFNSNKTTLRVTRQLLSSQYSKLLGLYQYSGQLIRLI